MPETKLQTYCKKLRALVDDRGVRKLSEAEIRRMGDLYQAGLDAEGDSEAECAPSGISDRELAGLNLDRASRGLPELRRDPADAPRGERPDLKRDLTQKQIDSINFERAASGKRPLSAEQIADLNLKRTVGSEGETASEPEFAPKGMHRARLASLNLERACRGERELLPYPDSDED